MTRLFQSSFSGGEFDPALHARIDLERFSSSLRTMENWYPLEYGPAVNRPGTQFVADESATGGSTVRFIPFIYGESDAYLLEFRDEEMRIIRNGALVTSPLRDSSHFWRASSGGTNEYYRYLPPVSTEPEYPALEPSDGELYIDGEPASKGTVGSLAAGEWGWGDNDSLGFDTVYVRLASGGDPDTASFDDYYINTITRIPTPYASADISRIGFSQSADAVYLTHPDYAPRVLTRSDHHRWDLSLLSFTAPAASASVVSDANTAVATNMSLSTTRSPSYVFSFVIDGQETQIMNNQQVVTVDAVWPAGGYVDFEVDISLDAGSEIEVGTPVLIYKGYGPQRGFIGESSVVSTGSDYLFRFEDDNITPDYTATPRGDPLEDFNSSADYPRAVCLFQQRLVLAATDNQPTTFWASVTGALDNFSVSSPPQGTDAIEARPASGRAGDGIRHVVPFDGLLLFTAGAEWLVNGDGTALAPDQINLRVQSYHGCAEQPAPLTVAKSVLFVGRGGRTIRDFAYEFSADGYVGNDLTLFARHITDGKTVVDWAFQREPHNLLWVVLSDGTAATLTYNREQRVWGWSRHTTDGYFKAVGVIPSADGTRDEVYFSVARTPSDLFGYTGSHIEVLAERKDDSVEGVFLDNSLTYSGSAATTVSGLDHLEGREVTAVADGSVVSGLTVTGGEITIPAAAETIHVGLPYNCDLETLDFDLQDERGTNQGRRQSVSGLVLRLQNTRGLRAGPDLDSLVEVPFREDEAWGDPPALFSGDKPVAITPSWRRASRVAIRQAYPLPATLLALLPEVQVGG